MMMAGPSTLRSVVVSDLNNVYLRRLGNVEAKQWDGSIKEFIVIRSWLTSHSVSSKLVPTSKPLFPELVIETPEGNKHARRDDWIVVDNGVCLLFTNETFNRQYVKPEDI